MGKGNRFLPDERGARSTESAADFAEMGVSGEEHRHLPPTRLLLVRFLAGQENEHLPSPSCFARHLKWGPRRSPAKRVLWGEEELRHTGGSVCGRTGDCGGKFRRRERLLRQVPTTREAFFVPARWRLFVGTCPRLSVVPQKNPHPGGWGLDAAISLRRWRLPRYFPEARPCARGWSNGRWWALPSGWRS